MFIFLRSFSVFLLYIHQLWDHYNNFSIIKTLKYTLMSIVQQLSYCTLNIFKINCPPFVSVNKYRFVLSDYMGRINTIIYFLFKPYPFIYSAFLEFSPWQMTDSAACMGVYSQASHNFLLPLQMEPFVIMFSNTATVISPISFFIYKFFPYLLLVSEYLISLLTFNCLPWTLLVNSRMISNNTFVSYFLRTCLISSFCLIALGKLSRTRKSVTGGHVWT